MCRRISDLKGNDSSFPPISTLRKLKTLWVWYLSLLCRSIFIALIWLVDLAMQDIEKLQYCWTVARVYWRHDGTQSLVSTSLFCLLNFSVIYYWKWIFFGDIDVPIIIWKPYILLFRLGLIKFSSCLCILNYGHIILCRTTVTFLRSIKLLSSYYLGSHISYISISMFEISSAELGNTAMLCDNFVVFLQCYILHWFIVFALRRDLSFNKLTGPIPDSFNGLSNTDYM